MCVVMLDMSMVMIVNSMKVVILVGLVMVNV